MRAFHTWQNTFESLPNIFSSRDSEVALVTEGYCINTRTLFVHFSAMFIITEHSQKVCNATFITTICRDNLIVSPNKPNYPKYWT